MILLLCMHYIIPPQTPFMLHGLAMISLHEMDAARCIFEEALELEQNQEGHSKGSKISLMKNNTTKIGTILNNMGCAMYAKKELDGAKQAFQQALQVFISLPKTKAERFSPNTAGLQEARNPIILGTTPTGRFHMSVILCNLGKALMKTKDYHFVIRSLEPAVEVSQSY